MSEVVGEGRVDIGQLQIVLGRDFISAPAEAIVPDGNVLHRNPVSCDARLSPTDVRRPDDPLIERLGSHESEWFPIGIDVVSTETNRSSCTAHHNGQD